MAPRTGDPAPLFTLAGVQDGQRGEWSLAAMLGRPVVLAFYPADFTPVCTVQLTTYTQDIGAFRDLGAQVLGISPQSVDSHERFAESLGGLAFPLLSDLDRSVAEAYGVLGPMGFYRRCVFVVDANGRLGYVHRGFAGSTYRRTPELVDAVRTAQG